MDTSKEYIKMCDCPEVQEAWKLKQGDWTTFPMTGVVSIKHVDEDDEYYSAEKIKAIKKYQTWLPRQDDIQGMLRKHYAQKIKSKRPHDKWFPEGAVGLSYVLCGFCTHIKKNQLLLEKYKSFEQLWLAYYMWEIDESVWVNNKWIN